MTADPDRTPRLSQLELDQLVGCAVVFAMFVAVALLIFMAVTLAGVVFGWWG